MRIFVNQTLASTNLDAQGERLSKGFLERACVHMAGMRFPVHQQHDMLRPVAGYIENVRLEEDPINIGEWCLIGDAYVDTGAVQDVLSGFSISGVEMIRHSSTPTAQVHLPFPHYNDAELLAELTADQDLDVGKWIRKSAEPIEWAVIGSVIAFAITPVWDDVYKRKIGPRIDTLVARLMPIFRRKGLHAELVQIVLFKDVEVEVRIIPLRGNEATCLNSSEVQRGLALVVAFLQEDLKAKQMRVS